MSEINAAGAAWFVDEPSDITDESTRATWTDAGIAAFLASLRDAYGADFVDRLRLARVESDARAADAGFARVVDCGVCEGPSTVTGFEHLAGVGHYRLDCHHLVRA